MQGAKIHLSTEQIKIVADTGFILTKNEILQKVHGLLGNFHILQKQVVVPARLPQEVVNTGGKISRGENYLGFPWLVLDYPRCFVKHNIFAIRIMFWWGKFFSTTLHLSGKWQQQFVPQLTAAFEVLQQNKFAVAVSDNEWLHDVSNASYKPLAEMDATNFETILPNAPFIKIAAYMPMEQINNATKILMQQFKVLIETVEEDTIG